MRKLLAEVSTVHSTCLYFSIFLVFSFNLIPFVVGMATMRENKEKTITSGDEDATAPPVIQKISVQTGKRKSKSISSAVDLDDLLSRRGPKKQKPSKASLPKVPKFTPPMVDLDDLPIDAELV